MSGFPADIATAPSWWFPYPGGAMAVSVELAAAWRAEGRAVLLGTYAEAAAAGRAVAPDPAATTGTQLSLFATEAA